MVVRALLVCLACATLMACGGDDASPSESAPPASTSSSPSTTVQPAADHTATPPANAGPPPAPDTTPVNSGGSGTPSPPSAPGPAGPAAPEPAPAAPLVLEATVQSTARFWFVHVAASSPKGIANVSAELDGRPFGTLTSPNACSPSCSGPSFQFTVDGWNGSDASQMTDHEMTITAVDEAGESRRLSVALRVTRAPVLEVSSPAEGEFFHGTLKVAGNAMTDTGGAATVTVTFGDVQLLETAAQSFATNFDLSGTAPGRHRLTIRAVDATTSRETTVTRNVIVASSRATVLESFFELDGDLLAVDGDRVLYRAGDDSVRMLDTITRSQVVLRDTAGILYGGAWQLAGSSVYTHGQGADCDAYNFVCVYEWQADGSRRNLTHDNPEANAPSRFLNVYQSRPVAHGDYVVWVNDGANSYTLYKAGSRAYTVIRPPPEIDRVGNTQYELTVDGGVVTFFYWGITSVGFPTTTDAYRWRSDTNTSTRLSNPGHRIAHPQTDGVRVAWGESSLDGEVITLQAQPVAGGTVSSLTSALADFKLRDGVLAWVVLPRMPGSRLPTAPPVLHASTATTITILSTEAGVFDVTGGHVLYAQEDKLFDWNSATGATRLLLDTPHKGLSASGKTVYLNLGEHEEGDPRRVYKLTLE